MKQLNSQLICFLIVGVLAVIIDYLIYQLFLWFAFGYNNSKASGFIAGTIFSYFANRSYTFSQIKWVWGSALRFGILYSFTLGTNVLVNHILLITLVRFHLKVLIAFIFVTSLTASLNFLGMKFFVFRPLRLTNN